MALTPADFYAYSRATGAPVPEDAEERAQMAPEVASFRRNQLKAPEQESNALQTIGLAALGIAGAIGGITGARRLMRPTTPKPVSAGRGTVPTDLTPVLQLAKRNAATKTTPPPSKIAAIPQATVDLTQVNKWLENPALLSEIELEESLSTLNPVEARSELARQQARVQKIKRENLWDLVKQIQSETITDVQQDLTPQIAHQTIGALESGEDQVTGRIMRGVQRNEDLDSSQVNHLAVQTGSAQIAASLTPDGIPFDQTKDLQVLGRFPGTEGSSTFGIKYTPVEARYQGRPVRYERLPMGGVTEGESFVSPLLTEGKTKYAAYGLTAPDTHVIPDDVAKLMQETIKQQGNKLETHQRQALDLFETTGDANYLAAAFETAPAMAYQGRLPGGETVQTKEFYIPIGERVNPQTGEPVVDTRLEALSRVEGPEGIRSRVREQTMQQIERMTGVRPVFPSEQQLESLPSVNKRAQRLAQRDVNEAKARYQQAQDFAVNYALGPEAKRGVYLSPEFEVNPLTGKENFIGMTPQVEQETIATPSLYQMRSSTGASRVDLGGIGRRRETLEGQGFSSFNEDPLAFLYKDVDTGELVDPGTCIPKSSGELI